MVAEPSSISSTDSGFVHGETEMFNSDGPDDSAGEIALLDGQIGLRIGLKLWSSRVVSLWIFVATNLC